MRIFSLCMRHTNEFGTEMKNTHTGLIRIRIRIRIYAYVICEKYAAGTVYKNSQKNFFFCLKNTCIFAYVYIHFQCIFIINLCFYNFSLKKIKILVKNKNTLILNVFIYENSLKKISFRIKIYVFSLLNTFTFNVFLLSTYFFTIFH